MSRNCKRIFSSLMMLFFVWTTQQACGQNATKLDTTAFEQQRQKINLLLNNRSQKFEEYDISLEQKTGVFGLFKTNFDMQKSLNILKEIVVNDNNIFIETRKLLDLKDVERERFQRMATEFDAQVTAYMKTVTKLQGENEKLRSKIDELEDEEHSTDILSYILGLIIIILGGITYKMYRILQSAKN